jgi:hypothetical protein
MSLPSLIHLILILANLLAISQMEVLKDTLVELSFPVTGLKNFVHLLLAIHKSQSLHCEATSGTSNYFYQHIQLPAVTSTMVLEGSELKITGGA